MLFGLLFQHFIIEAKEPFNSWSVFLLQILHPSIQFFQSDQNPLINLNPILWEIVLDKQGDNEGELLIVFGGEDDVVRVGYKLEQFILDLLAKFVRDGLTSLRDLRIDTTLGSTETNKSCSCQHLCVVCPLANAALRVEASCSILLEESADGVLHVNY